MNLWRLYAPLAETWRVYGNSGSELRLVAHGGPGWEGSPTILDGGAFAKIKELADAGEASAEGSESV